VWLFISAWNGAGYACKSSRVNRLCFAGADIPKSARNDLCVNNVYGQSSLADGCVDRLEADGCARCSAAGIVLCGSHRFVSLGLGTGDSICPNASGNFYCASDFSFACSWSVDVNTSTEEMMTDTFYDFADVET